MANIDISCQAGQPRRDEGQAFWRYVIGTSINLSLTDELRDFIDANSGDGTLYATPSEFVRDLLRQQKMRQEAAAVRDGILEGYQDAILGRSQVFQGNLRSVLRKAASTDSR